MKTLTNYFRLVAISVLLFGLFKNVTAQNSCNQNWLTVSGNKLLDVNNNEVILAGANWFGFETKLNIPHGLYARDVDGMLENIKRLGFNCLRLPWHNGMLRDGARFDLPNFWVKDPISYDGSPMGPFSNLAIQSMTKPLEVMDYIVEWCQENNLKIILDCHSRNPDAYLIEKLWFTENVSEQQWIDDWVFLTERYKQYSAVVGMDINNEPNGKIDNPKGARWGTGDQYDWRLASERCGNAILEANPNVLILVEGIEAYNKPNGEQTSYWWGGNLQGVRDFPVRLSNPNKLVYSPHEYGPRVFDQVWFSAPDFPENMDKIWEDQFNFINTSEISPLLIGELGIQGRGGKDEIWFAKFIDFIKKKKLHFTFWAINPNSGDTGGIFENDWITVEQWKLDYLKPILSQEIPNCLASNNEVLSIRDLTQNLTGKQSLFVSVNEFKLEVVAKEIINQIEVFDISGKKVFELNNLASKIVTSTVPNLNNGIYIFKIGTSKSKTLIKKIVKK